MKNTRDDLTDLERAENARLSWALAIRTLRETQERVREMARAVKPDRESQD